MALDISFQPMRLVIDGHDSEGHLVLSKGQLAAVIARLDSEHHVLSTRGNGTWRPGSANATSVTRPCSRRLTKPEFGLNKP
jgi:hypothetical protein